MYMTALRESRKLRAAEEKVQWDLLAPKKSHRLREFWSDYYLLCV